MKKDPRFRFPWRNDRQIRAEVEEEIAFHLDMRTEELIRAGLDPNAARAQAEHEFGDSRAAGEALQTTDREAERRARRTEWLAGLRHDLRLAMRRLVRSPGFSIVAVLTLALGIGANTTLFSVVHAVLLRPLPYPDPDRLVVLWQDHQGRGGEAEQDFNRPDFQELRERTRSIVQVAAVYPRDAALSHEGHAERVSMPIVSHEYFDLFGVQPALGRLFRSEDETRSGDEVVVLSHSLWQRRFGADPKLVGRSVVLDDEPYTVIGIAEAGFRPPEGESDLWATYSPDPTGASWRFYTLRVFGRLSGDAGLEEARAELDALSSHLAEDYPGRNQGVSLRVESLRERVVGSTSTALWVLFGAAGLVLLLACANLANLLRSRAAVREREFAIRAALGAGRGRIVRQLLTESLVLAGLGGLLGIGVAYLGVHLISVLVPADMPRLDEVSINAPVLAFAVVLSVLTGIVFGLAPALRAASSDLRGGLRPGAAGNRNVAGDRRGDGLLVVSQVAIALMLLAGAGLLMGSFVRLLSVDPGFDPTNVLTVEFSAEGSRYRERSQVVAFYNQLEEQLAAVPGVQSVGSVTALPLADESSEVALQVEGRGDLPTEEQPRAHYRFASPGYFRTMGIALRAGRPFSGRDRLDAPGVAVVNETLARRLWPGNDPIGMRFSPEWYPDRSFTVVGVVADVRHHGLDESPLPEIYFPAEQLSGGAAFRTLVVRTASDPLRMAARVRDAVRDLDPGMPVDSISSMEGRLGDSVAMPRLYLLLFGLFAALAVGLAALGIYGVLSATVVRRTREIGIRMALGSKAGDVLRLVFWRSLALTGTGIILGIAGSLVLTRMMRSMLYEVTPTDPLTFGGVTIVLAAVALLASYIPARRATRVDPQIALRAE
jgi:putative ABC transport system permease protein